MIEPGRMPARMGRACTTAALSGLLLAGLLPPVSPGSASAQVRATAKVGWGYDSNVDEALSRARRDGDGFAHLEAALACGRRGQAGLAGELRWAAQRYQRHMGESRRLTAGSLNWRRGARAPSLECGWMTSHADYPAAGWRNIWRHELRVRRQTTLSGAWRAELRGQAVWVAAREDGPGDRRAWLLAGGLRRSWGRHWVLAADLEGGRLRYERAAMGCPRDDGAQDVSGERQRDRSLHGVLRFTRGGLPLLSGAYGLRRVWSNSFGFSFDRHELRLTAGLLLPHQVSVQCIARWQSVRYVVEDYLIVLPAEDAEDADLGARSGFTVQVSRPLGGGLVAELRGSWEHNEALALRRFYEKTYIQAAFRYASIVR